ncbi:palmitoyltransferase ZDHHC15 isoform X1 [Drosophila subpulchrella]|uniref:palmitoyltransferase ZDHHC15 isoform X1 n=2 Tax=Drosophila subpulchrella TaxID=1486046 RepID=UPI0018A18D53|nr:palmitoyltransferase ZDHHC15 isoform X1 [Drosophila subpulchrella]
MCLVRENEERRKSSCCVIRWFPFFIIVAMLVWSYHVLVYQICIIRVEDYVVMGLLLFFYHLLLLMFLWTWWKCICVDPVKIPDQWKLSAEDVERLQRTEGVEGIARILNNAARNLPISTCSPEGLVRYCKTCWIIKPDRAHHCRTCHVCVLKMDHHCPWVVNCVHFHNFKYFIQFLLYAELYMLYLFFVMMYEFYLICGFDVSYLKNEHTWNLVQHVVCITFNIFTLVMYSVSVFNVSRNRTTMESAHPTFFFVGGKNSHGFNLGCRTNFRELMGDKWYLWPFPIFSSRGDGLSFPLAVERLKEVRTDNQRKDDGPTRAQIVKGNVTRILGIHHTSFDRE